MKRLFLMLAFTTTCAWAQNAEVLTLPNLKAVTVEDTLNVATTTSLIGDVVTQVGGDAVDLTTLIAPGQDPHGFEPAARDLARASKAQVVFVNGWGLEETLLDTLRSVAEGVPFVPVAAGITPLSIGGNPNPHTWLSVENVMQWTTNIRDALSTLDPANAEAYAANAEAYLAQLRDLETYAETTLINLPEERRKLVTLHDAYGYFAEAYGFEIVGSVIGSSSTLAEPSAGGLAGLIDEMTVQGICTLFADVNESQLVQTVADELTCDEVQVLSLYTETLGAAGSGAESYLGMMRTNIDTIFAGLSE